VKASQNSKHLNKVGSTVQTADGKFLKLQDTITKTPQGLQKVSRSVKDVTKSYSQSSKGTKELSKNTVSLTDNIKRLGSRALLTIPLWLALRGAMMGTIRTIKDGIKNIGEFDRKLQKAKRNMSGSTVEITKNFAELKKEVTAMSLKTGISVENITDAFQKFKTTGQDFDTAMTGAIESTKLASVLFGDTVQNANAFARVFRVLGGQTDKYKNKSEELKSIMALTATLWKDQAFEVDELSSAMERFAPVAKTTGTSLEDSLKILSALQTSGVRGTRAGRLLSSAMLQLDKNFDKLQSTLGLKVNPNITTTFDRLQIVTDEISRLQRIDPLKATQALQDLFGGVRSAQVPASLSAMSDNLKKVLAQTGDIKDFNNQFEDVTVTVGVLQKRFTNLNKEIGKAFVTGLVGGKDFKTSLEDIVDTQEESVDGFRHFGTGLRLVAKNANTTMAFLNLFKGGLKEISKAMTKSYNDLDLLNEKLQKGFQGKLTPIDMSSLIQGLDKGDKIFKTLNYDAVLNRLAVGLKKSTDEIRGNLKSAIFDGVSREDLEKLAKDLEGMSPEFFNLDDKDFDKLLTAVDTALSQVDDKLKVAEKRKYKIPIELDVSSEQITDINKSFIESNVDILKSEGALTSEIIDRKNQLEKTLGINQDMVSLIDRQLQKERALSEEKRLQSRLGSESLKLFRIAKEDGADVARKIADVLSGKTDLSLFLKKGGKEAELFKKNFGDVLEQQQSQAFFKGDVVPGVKGLRGGRQIDIQEQSLRGLGTQSQFLLDRSQILNRQRAQQGQITQQPITKMDVQVPVDIQVKLDPSKIKEFEDQTIAKVVSGIKKVGSDVNRAINNVIYGNQQSNR